MKVENKPISLTAALIASADRLEGRHLLWAAHCRAAHILAGRVLEEHGEPEWASLHRDDDDLPYLLPVGAETSGADLAYRLTADDLRLVIARGWDAIASYVAEEWGARAAVLHLRAEAMRA